MSRDRRLVENTRMNIDRVMENLRRKGDEAVTAAKTALREGVNNIVNDAKSRCPVKTGKLRDSIHAESLEDGAIYKITTDAKNDDNVSYAQYVEYSPRINRPFMHPAIDANISRLSNGIKNAIRNSLQE